MRDRTPTKVLPNGAIRYGVYDENGALIRYEYIKPEDEPTQEGTPYNKESVLKDATAALYGKGSDAVPDDIFAEIKSMFNASIKIATGTVTASFNAGDISPKTITTPFVPKVIIAHCYSAYISNENYKDHLYYGIAVITRQGMYEIMRYDYTDFSSGGGGRIMTTGYKITGTSNYVKLGKYESNYHYGNLKYAWVAIG